MSNRGRAFANAAKLPLIVSAPAWTDSDLTHAVQKFAKSQRLNLPLSSTMSVEYTRPQSVWVIRLDRPAYRFRCAASRNRWAWSKVLRRHFPRPGTCSPHHARKNSRSHGLPLRRSSHPLIRSDCGRLTTGPSESRTCRAPCSTSVSTNEAYC